MISSCGASPLRSLHRQRGAHDRAHLHLVDLGVDDRRAGTPRVPSIGLVSARWWIALERLLELLEVVAHLDPRALDLLRDLRLVRQELVQRRVEQADRDRQPRHLLEEALEVLLLERQELVERGAARVLLVGHDHRAHLRLALRRHEHVLGPAEADPLGAELARLARVLRRVGVRAHAELAHLVGPREHALEVARRPSGATSGTSAVVTMPVVPSIAIRSPAVQHGAVHAHLARREVDLELGRAGHRRAGPSRARRAPRGWPCRPRS